MNLTSNQSAISAEIKFFLSGMGCFILEGDARRGKKNNIKSERGEVKVKKVSPLQIVIVTCSVLFRKVVISIKNYFWFTGKLYQLIYHLSIKEEFYGIELC
jgi:hypothetical protein